MSDLLKENKSGWLNTSDDSKKLIFEFSKEYMNFLNNSKIEREIIENATEIAKEHGFKHLNEYSEFPQHYH